VDEIAGEPKPLACWKFDIRRIRAKDWLLCFKHGLDGVEGYYLEIYDIAYQSLEPNDLFSSSLSPSSRGYVLYIFHLNLRRPSTSPVHPHLIYPCGELSWLIFIHSLTVGLFTFMAGPSKEAYGYKSILVNENV